MAAKPRLLNTFLLGADPEFVCKHKANGTLVNMQGRLQEPDLIGLDHGGRVCEVHPNPAKGTYLLVKRIQTILTRQHPNVELLRAYKLKAGAMAGDDAGADSLGGHLHYGVPAIDGFQMEALDSVVDLFTELDLLPAGESARRREGLYGRHSDVRPSQHSVEYRTPPSWLYSPKTAFLILTAGKLAMIDKQDTTEDLQEADSFEDLQNWFEKFATKDDNARRVVEKLFPLRALKADPDADLNVVWGKKLGF